MAIPGPGTPIDLTDLATEFGDSAPHSISEFYRGGGKVPDSSGNSAIPTSGTIALGNFYGSQNRVALSLTITGNTNNYNLYNAVSGNSGYSAGATDITLTVNPGVTVGSSSVSTYALAIPSALGAGDTVKLVNKGTIIGKGGNGGRGQGFSPLIYHTAGQAGGHALYLNRPVSVQNNGVLSGGGGGGGGSAGYNVQGFYPKSGQPSGTLYTKGGSGGGGGAGRNIGTGGVAGNSNPTGYAGGTAGSNGTATNGGAGGPDAGAGGNRGANGAASTRNPTRAGGTRGRYITGNSFATWLANGTRLGAAS